MKRKEKPAQPPAAVKSARAQFEQIDGINEKAADNRREKLRDAMSENLYRIALWLPKMLQDEMELRTRNNSLSENKLKEFYFGGFPLERIRSMRIGVNVFQIVMSPYGQTEIEAMPGFKHLVKACASPDVDMNVRVIHNPNWASQMIEIGFDCPFDRNGPYNEIVANKIVPAAPTDPDAPLLQVPKHKNGPKLR